MAPGGGDDDCDGLDPLPARLRGIHSRRSDLLGFELSVTGGDGTTVVDRSWHGATGGGLNIAVDEGADGSLVVGAAFVDDLVLRGPLTAGRKWVADMIQATLAGSDARVSITVKEILKDGSAGKTYPYHDCFPTRYVFPSFSASGTGNLYEEVAIKPIRLEIQ